MEKTSIMKKKNSFLFNTFILLLFLLFANQAYSKNQAIKITGKNLTIKEVFQQIENQTDLSIGYDESVLNVDRKIDGEIGAKDLKNVLNTVLAGTDNVAEFSGKYVLIKETSKNQGITQQSAAKIEVKGNVTDIDGFPLIGVSVSVVGNAAEAAITDIDGNYSILVSGKHPMLKYTYIGFIPTEVEVSGRKVINVTLEEDMGQLEEVVVVGYGSQKKESVIGAISSISPQYVKGPASKISTQLAGQLSGVLAVQRSGEPGAGSTFWIRGISTFGANSNPLVLVDGVERSMDLVNTEDIKEFSILKDAAATAVYGVRGANGVVLITTRGGEEGPTRISVRAEYGILSPTKVPDMLDAVQFSEMYNDALGYTYYSPEVIEKFRNGSDPEIYPNVNWIDELYKNNTMNTRINANISGGSKNFKYYVSGGLYHEDGLFIADQMKEYNTSVYYQQYNFRSNVDINIAKYTVLNVNLATTFERKNEPGTGGSDIWQSAMETPSNAFPMIYSNGYLPGPGEKQGYNPYSRLTQTGYVEKFYNTAQSTIGVTQDFSEYITKGLKANVKFAFDARNVNHLKRTRTPEEWRARRDSEGEIIYEQLVKGGDALSFSQVHTGTRMTYVEASMNYNRTFGLHNVGGLFLYQHSQKNILGDDAKKSEDALAYRNQGIAGRFTYNYDSRYFIEGNFGYNGSENFSRGKRFGFFPSIAMGWMLSEEKFFAPLTDVVDMFKIKGSYGLVGNDKIGGGRRFVYLGTIQAGGKYHFGEDLREENSIRMGEWANDNVGWEESRKMDIGVDISLFNKVKIQADYFAERRKGIFLERKSIPYYVGITNSPYVNMGKMRNKGFDASLEYHHTINELYLSARGNFTYARNVILDQDQPDYLYKYRNQTGQARWQQYGYIAAGIFRDQEDVDSWVDQTGIGGAEPGDIKYYDLNGDGKIDANDQKPIGYRDVPEIVYGFGVSARWKGFDLSVFFQGNAHVNFSMRSNLTQPFLNPNINQANGFADVYNNYWTPERPDAKYPRLTASTNSNNSPASTFWLADGSYLRIKSAEFGYTLPQKLTRSWGMRDVRFFMSGLNLFTFSNFKLWDPDLQTGATTYPPNRVINFGLSVNF